MLTSRDVIVLLFAIIFTGVTALQVRAEIPQQMSYQGRLTDDTGAPVPDNIYTIRFVIHEEILADTPLWEETQNVLAINGIFNTLLPADPVTNPFTEPVRFGRFLGITVDSDPEMSPRQPLASTLFSFLSGLSEDAEQLHGNTLSDLDDRYVNVGETEIINSDMIQDGAITAGDLSESYMPADGGVMSGGMIVHGSLAIGAHVSRPFYNILGTGTPVSGFMNNEYDLFVADDLEAAGHIFAYGNLYVGTDDSADDDYIYFDSTNEYIRWEEDLDDNSLNGNNGGFYLSDDLEVIGDIGIGTSTPTESLHIDMGGSGARSFLKIESSHPSNWGEAGLRIETPQNMWHFRMDDDSNNNIPAGSLSLRSQNSGIEVVTWDETGNVGIGTTTPNNKLDVKGTIRAEEVIVEIGWADYVFEEEYVVMTLEDLESFIEESGHLPGLPTEKEVQEVGIGLGEFQVKLLEKVEELTLYLIKQNNKLAEQEKVIAATKEELNTFRHQLRNYSPLHQ